MTFSLHTKRARAWVVVGMLAAAGCSAEAAGLVQGVFGEDALVPVQVPTLTAASTTVTADGKQSTKLTLSFADRYGRPLTGYAVNFNSSVPSDWFSPGRTQRTNCSGQASVAFTPQSSGRHMVRASVGRTSRKIQITGSCPGVLMADKAAIGDGSFYAGQLLALDVTRDGYADAVTQWSGSMKLAKGYGNGLFQASYAALAITGINAGLANADFNNDGNIDFVSTNANANTVLVTLSNSSVFTSTVSYSAGAGALGVATLDLNRDGNMDVVVANQNANTLSIFIGDGNGVLIAMGSVTTLNKPSFVAAGDVNGDGNADIIVTNYSANARFAVHLGTGTSSLRSPLTYNMNSSLLNPSGIAIADFNKDGYADLFFNAQQYAALYSGNDNAATFNKSTLYSPACSFASSTQTPIVGDFNNDGFPDVAWTACLSGWQIGFGDRSATLVVGPTYVTQRNIISIASADFNSDGWLDAIVDGGGACGALAYLNRGDGNMLLNFNTAWQVSRIVSVSVADFNRDGNLDVIGAGYDTNAVILSLGDGHGSLITATSIATGNAPTYTVVADFNQDTLLDVASVNQGSNTVTILFGDGNGMLSNPITVATGNYPTNAVTADFNGDGYPDLAVTNTNSNTLSILFNRGGTAFNNPNSLATGNSPWGVAAADVNKDGRVDAVVTNANSGSITLYLNQVGGPLTQAASYQLGATPYAVGIKDFNGDGNQDLLVTNVGNYYVFTGNGSGIFSITSSASMSQTGYSMALGDMNGDTKWDFAVVDNYQTVRVIYGQGDGTFRIPSNNATILGTQMGPQGVAVGDFDNDSYPDVVTANFCGRSFGIFLNAKCAF